MKTESKTTTRVTVTISKSELIELARGAGIRVPDGVEVNVYGAPFDDDSDGALLEWWEVPVAEKQG